MSKLEMYEAYLQRKVEAGDTEAQMVLNLAAAMTEPKRPRTDVIASRIQMAIRNCQESLRINAQMLADSSSSDDECREAIDHLADALAHLPCL